MFYSGIAFFAFAMLALVLDLMGLTPGAAGLVNVALVISVLLVSAAGAVPLAQRHLALFHRRQASRDRQLASAAHGASGLRA